MGKRARVQGRADGDAGSDFDAVRHVLQSDQDLGILSPQEMVLLTSQLTSILARVERVRSLGPAYAGVGVSPDVQQLLVRLEVGSSLTTGVH